MAQVFPRHANLLVSASVILGGLFVVIIASVAVALYHSPSVTQVGVVKEQPIPFSHERHVAGNAIDCRYCHTSVETSSFAGIPSTDTCMTCHSQVLADAPMLRQVHESFITGDPIEWTRVHDMPDFVYFDHSIHIAKGVGCTTCHGQVDQMPLTFKATRMSMAWCLDCHKAPEKYVRPLEEVFNPEWEPPANQLDEGRRLVQEYGINVPQLTNCSICHR